jgi:hypothetical protein
MIVRWALASGQIYELLCLVYVVQRYLTLLFIMRQFLDRGDVCKFLS